jgi:hypothetical protein
MLVAAKARPDVSPTRGEEQERDQMSCQHNDGCTQMIHCFADKLARHPAQIQAASEQANF